MKRKQIIEAAAPESRAGEPNPRRWWILAVLCFSLVLVVASVSSVNVALPSLQRALNASGADLQWIVDAYALAFAGLLLPLGAMGDRWGRKGMLLTGLALFGGFSALAATSISPGWVIAYRGVMGASAGAIMPATLSIITVVFPAKERPRAVAIWAAFAGIGGVIGPTGSGLLLKYFWWGSVFFITVPIAAILLAAVILIVPTSRDEEHRPLDPIGSALSIVGLGGLLYAIIEGPVRGWTSAPILVTFLGSIFVLVLFVRWERRNPYPMLDPKYFRSRYFTLGSVTITMVFFSLFGMFFLMTQYFQFAQGHSALDTGLRTLPAGITMLLVAPLSPAATTKFGPRVTLGVGLVLGSLGLGILALLSAASHYAWVVLALAVMAAGLALLMPPSTHAIVASLPKHKAGVGSAVNDTTREVGGAIGIAVLGSLLAVGYRERISGNLVDLPEEMMGLAGDSVGGALRVAENLPPEQGARLTEAAIGAFESGMTLSMGIGAAVLFATAGLIFWLYPTKAIDDRDEEA